MADDSEVAPLTIHCLPASMEPIPNMNEDDYSKEILRFMTKGELIRLAEIGLAIEMH
jgi:hypothetical protein